MTTTPTPGPAKRGRRSGWHWLLLPCRMVWYTVLVALLALLFLWGVGLPAPWSNSIAREFWPPARDLDIRRLRVHPTRGLLLEALALRVPGLDDAPVVADRVVLRPEWAREGEGWASLRPVVREVGVHNGRLRITPPGDIPLGVSNLVGNLLLTPDNTLRIRQATADVAGIRLRAHGEVALPQAAAAQPRPDLPRIWGEAAARLPAWVMQLPYDRTGHAPGEPPEVTLHLRTDPDGQVRVSLMGRAGDLTLEGRTFDEITLLAELARERVALHAAEARMDGRRLHLSGSWTPDRDEIEGHVFTDLPPQQWIAFLPSALRTNAVFTRLDLDGSFTSEGWIGPCPAAEWRAHWNGWLSVDGVTIGPLPVHRGFVSARRRGDRIELEQMHADAGTGPGRGRVEASAVINLATMTMDGETTFDLDLAQAGDLLPPPLANLAATFAFDEQPHAFTGSFTTSLTNVDYSVTGRLTGAAFRYRGVPVNTLRCDLRVAPGRVDLDRLFLTRDQGEVDGSLRFRFNPFRTEVDLRATTPPLSTLMAVDTNLARNLGVFAIRGSSLVEAKGLLHHASPEHSDLLVTVSASDVGLDWVRFDTVAGQWRYTGDRVDASNLVVQAYDGTVTGRVDWIQGDPGRTEVRLNARDLAFNRLIADRRSMPFDHDVGRLRLNLNLDLMEDDPTLDRMTGNGRVAVREGSLMRVPVFGGLSTLLSTVYPGLGYADQSTFTADFTLSNRLIRTGNAFLSGNVISLKARGTYDLDDDLDFVVQVKPLRSGLLADALRLVTLPLTKLLEFRLTGPLNNEQWRAPNLPEELPVEGAPP